MERMPLLLKQIFEALDEVGEENATCSIDKVSIFGVSFLSTPSSEYLIRSSRKADNLIKKYTRRFVKDNRQLEKIHEFSEIIKAVRTSIGGRCLDIEESTESQKGDIQWLTEQKDTLKVEIIDYLSNRSLNKDFVYGAWLVNNEDFKGLRIGPVEMMPRLVWLESVTVQGRVSAHTYRRLKKVWLMGGKLRRRKIGVDSEKEAAILSSVGDCPIVCAVETLGLSESMAREKSLLAARIALTSIALHWEYPSNKLEHFHLSYDRRMGIRKYFYFQGESGYSSSQKVTEFSGWELSSDKEKASVYASEKYYRTIAPILMRCVGGNVPKKHERLYDQLMHAFIWFHDACCEKSPLVSICKYVFALDALASGKKEDKITELVAKVFNRSVDCELFGDGETLKVLIKKAYSDVRSRSLHGNSELLLSDLSYMRGKLELITSACLRVIIHRMSELPDCKTVWDVVFSNE